MFVNLCLIVDKNARIMKRTVQAINHTFYKDFNSYALMNQRFKLMVGLTDVLLFA
jgi:hypothetical protein